MHFYTRISLSTGSMDQYFDLSMAAAQNPALYKYDVTNSINIRKA